VARQIYFETSAWNRLADLDDSQVEAVRLTLQRRGDIVLASIINVGEILRTDAPERLRRLCRILGAVHPSGAPFLDHPEYLLEAIADSWRRGELAANVRESEAASALASYVRNPDALSADDLEIVHAWVRAMDADQDAIFEDLKDVGPREGPRFCSGSVLDSLEFNQLLVDKIPFMAKKNLSPEEVARLCEASDIWKAYRAMVAFVIDAAIDEMPPERPGRRRPQKRPGGPDLRQAMYLGACDTFVLRDEWLDECLRAVSAACRLERRLVSPDEFFEEALDSRRAAGGRGPAP
jgi:hypothetical protein